MDFSDIIEELKRQKTAAFSYEKSGQNRFRDKLVIGQNGKLLFERYNYGEAAGLVFSMWGTAGAEGVIHWDTEKAADYAGKNEAPARLTGAMGATGLEFDGKKQSWERKQAVKSWPEAGLSRLKMLFM